VAAYTRKPVACKLNCRNGNGWDGERLRKRRGRTIHMEKKIMGKTWKGQAIAEDKVDWNCFKEAQCSKKEPQIYPSPYSNIPVTLVNTTRQSLRLSGFCFGDLQI
jgi:hypothetical protein